MVKSPSSSVFTPTLVMVSEPIFDVTDRRVSLEAVARDGQRISRPSLHLGSFR